MRTSRDLALTLAALAIVAVAGTFANDYWIGVGISVLMAIALAQSWALFSALSGYVSLGHVVFYGLGAYVVVVTWNIVPLPLALVLAAFAAAGFAFIIGLPVLRVRGPYFVILTLGIAELVKYVLIAVEAALGHASRLILGAPDPIVLYYMLLGLAAVATLLAAGVRLTRLGHGLRALREDEEAAETLGVPVTRYKLTAFVLSAAVPGAVGGVMALRATYFEPSLVFDPMISFAMIAMTIIGGSDDLRGPVLGAVLLTGLSELLWDTAPQAYMVILGVLLVIFVRFVPDGLSGLLRRAR
ncbi:MAG: branched-chain amino acid ABC transporter permease [Stellaceae bacterium]